LVAFNQELDEVVASWRKELNAALNSAIAYKDCCVEWRHRYEDMEEKYNKLKGAG
jgi:hypothetical protein